MNPSDSLIVAAAIKPILKQAQHYRRAARLANQATPQFGPEFELPDSFGIQAEYRMFKGQFLIPVLATGHWVEPADC